MNGLLLSPAFQRVGLAVLHALWELAALGLLAWAGLALLRRRSPQVRYAWACALLAAMLLAPLLTLLQLEPRSDHLRVLVLAGEAAAPPVGGSAGPGLRSLVDGAAAAAPWLALLWILGAALMTARLGAGLWWLEHRYLTQARPVPEAWQASLDRLGARMSLGRRVRLLESLRADSPILVGWFRPAVLLPAAALLHLSPESLEAVLAHELAHVRRADYLVNLLQSIAEALLFFHPCAWWLSGRIRELREHCCDDAAAALCGDPMALAEGLSGLERMRRRIHTDPEPALAAAKGNLMSRITRLFTPQEVQIPSLRGLVLGLAGASLLGAAALAAQQTTGTPKAKPAGSAKAGPARLAILKQPPAPPYPAEARAKGIQGAVVLRLTVDAEGQPGSVEVLQGPEELRAAAQAYAQGWRFRLPKGADPSFQLNLLYVLKGSAGPGANPAALPRSKGPSATVEIVASAGAARDGVLDIEFSRIKILHRPKAPDYPAEAKEQRIQGTVVVELVVDEKGVPVEARAVEGPEQLAPAAVAYAKDWRFEPLKVDGKPAKARFKLTMPFKLR